ncbi:MAG: transcription elongation factor Spt5 [Candidatus Woesearchaeota archaeon]
MEENKKTENVAEEEKNTTQEISENSTEDLNKDSLQEVDNEIKDEAEEINAVDNTLKEKSENEELTAPLNSIDKDIETEEKHLGDIDKELAEVDKEIEKDNAKLEETSTDESDELIAELNASEQKQEEIEAEKKAKQEEEEAKKEKNKEESKISTHIFAVRTTANREDQVMDFLTTNAEKKGFNIYSIIRPHGMRGYIFVEADTRGDVEQGATGVPYARGVLPNEIEYKEIEHMLEQVKREVDIRQNDIVEIISGPFKRENAKVIRIDKSKEEVVVGLLEAAVPIPITLKLDAVKVIRRDNSEKPAE